METINYQHLLFEYKDDVVKQLESLAKVAKRVGVPAPTWTIGETYEHEFTALMEQGYGEDGDGEVETFIEKVFDIEINIEQSIKMEGGWQIAALMIHETGTFQQINLDVEIPGKYSPKVAVCEHCGRNFPRVKSFLIFNERGEWKQVGKTCMKQFLGINPISYISMFEAVSKMSNYIMTLGYAKNRGGRMENLAYNVEDMLRYTIGQLQRDGGVFTKTEWKEVVIEEGHYTRWGVSGRKTKMVRTNEPNATIDKVRFIINANSKFKFNPSELVAAEALTEDISVYQAEYERLDTIQKSLADAHQALCDSLKPAPQIGQNQYEAWMTALTNNVDVINAKNASNEAYAEYAEAKAIFELKTAHYWYLTGLNDLKSNDEVVAKVKDWATAIEPKMKKDELDGDEYFANDFESFKAGIKDTFSRNRVLQTNLKFICSGYNTFLKDEAYKVKNAERLAKAATLTHVGVVGEKSHLVVKVTGKKQGNGNFGTWTLWSLGRCSG
jgi:hypothetical protein